MVQYILLLNQQISGRLEASLNELKFLVCFRFHFYLRYFLESKWDFEIAKDNHITEIHLFNSQTQYIQLVLSEEYSYSLIVKHSK